MPLTKFCCLSDRLKVLSKSNENLEIISLFKSLSTVAIFSLEFKAISDSCVFRAFSSNANKSVPNNGSGVNVSNN